MYRIVCHGQLPRWQQSRTTTCNDPATLPPRARGPGRAPGPTNPPPTAPQRPTAKNEQPSTDPAAPPQRAGFRPYASPKVCATVPLSVAQQLLRVAGCGRLAAQGGGEQPGQARPATVAERLERALRTLAGLERAREGSWGWADDHARARLADLRGRGVDEGRLEPMSMFLSPRGSFASSAGPVGALVGRLRRYCTVVSIDERWTSMLHHRCHKVLVGQRNESMDEDGEVRLCESCSERYCPRRKKHREPKGYRVDRDENAAHDMLMLLDLKLFNKLPPRNFRRRVKVQ